MPQLADLPNHVKPLKIYTYFDKLTLWLKRPLDRVQLAALRRECGYLYDATQPARFDRRYQQYLDLNQPSLKAQHMLGRIDGAHLNYVELALDLVLRNRNAAQWWNRFFQAHFLQDWHRDSMGVETYPDGGHSTRPARRGKPRPGRWFQHYSDRPCRITHDPHCFHFEAKLQGIAAVRKLGIAHPSDLLDFDFENYFARSIKLFDLDLHRLGRFHQNRRSGSCRQKPMPDDYQIGSQLYRDLSIHPVRCPTCRTKNAPGAEYCEKCNHPIHPAVVRSLQQFVDRHGRGPFLRPLFETTPLLIMLMHRITFTLSETLVPSNQVGNYKRNSQNFHPNSIHLPSIPVQHAEQQLFEQLIEDRLIEDRIKQLIDELPATAHRPSWTVSEQLLQPKSVSSLPAVPVATPCFRLPPQQQSTAPNGAAGKRVELIENEPRRKVVRSTGQNNSAGADSSRSSSWKVVRRGGQNNSADANSSRSSRGSPAPALPQQQSTGTNVPVGKRVELIEAW